MNKIKDFKEMDADEFCDAVDDWELAADEIAQEEVDRLAEEERRRKREEEKEKNTRVGGGETEVTRMEELKLTDEGKRVLDKAREVENDARAAASLLGNKVERICDRSVTSEADAKQFAADVAKRFVEFESSNDFAQHAVAPVFKRLLEAFKSAKEVRDLDAVLQVAKNSARHNKKTVKTDKKSDLHVEQHNALDLDTSDRGGAEAADEFF